MNEAVASLRARAPENVIKRERGRKKSSPRRPSKIENASRRCGRNISRRAIGFPFAIFACHRGKLIVSVMHKRHDENCQHGRLTFPGGHVHVSIRQQLRTGRLSRLSRRDMIDGGKSDDFSLICC